MTDDQTELVLRRWRANAAAAGVRLTDDDIERSRARGFFERVLAVEAILARLDAREVVPDDLHILSAQSDRDARGGADG